MNIYDKIEMHTFGSLPTIIEREIPIVTTINVPTPFIPIWIKCIIGGLVVTAVLLFIFRRKGSKKNETQDKIQGLPIVPEEQKQVLFPIIRPLRHNS